VAAVSTQNLRQILAAVLQYLVDGSAACVVFGVEVGTVFDEKLDDLLAVLRVLAGIVQGSASVLISDIHALWILAQ
jgi:hypothetical protein